MKISEVVKLLETIKARHGDIPVCCITDDGPGGMAEDCLLAPRRFRYHEQPHHPIASGPHLMIGEYI